MDVMKRKVEVVEHNEDWKNKFNKEAERIKKALGRNITNIYHIGSTSIPNIKAKPIIDILVSVNNIDKVDNHNKAMEDLEYEAMGEFGIKGRRYFRKGGNNRTYHVHIFHKENNELDRHINFRDYMIAHPEDAKKYSELKESLAKKYTYNIEKYIEGKDSFIKSIDQKAKEWKKGI